MKQKSMRNEDLEELKLEQAWAKAFTAQDIRQQLQLSWALFPSWLSFLALTAP